MSRFREGLSDDDATSEIDMSPLIDCVFILLMFFIVTTTFVEEVGVEVDKPQAASSVSLESSSVMFSITEKGQVLHEDEEVGIGAVQRIVRQALQIEDVPVVVQADATVPAGRLVQLVGEARVAGAKNVSVATRK